MNPVRRSPSWAGRLDHEASKEEKVNKFDATQRYVASMTGSGRAVGSFHEDLSVTSSARVPSCYLCAGYTLGVGYTPALVYLLTWLF